MDIFNFIKERISIVTVISEYVSLKKAGGYLKGQCPFHNERTGSFTISPHKEIFYCFGCHQGGDVISFIASIERLSPLEAARHIIDRYQIELPTELSSAQLKTSDSDQKRYELVCRAVATWCVEQLQNSTQAQEYLHQRGIRPQSIALFSLGYFPAGTAALKKLRNYLQQHNLLMEDLLNAHLVLQGKQDYYSPFEERIIFPIYDHLGRCRGFGGRVFKLHDTRPKYYNSHDHEFFEKGTILFGFDKAKKEIQQRGMAFLAEGYIDGIMMHQAGYHTTVATLGTACTLEHLSQLSRYAQQLYIIYDGDSAGKKAVERLAHLCWQVNIDLLIITLPDNDDPASFLSKHADIAPLVEKAEDIFMFLIKQRGVDFHSKGLADKLNAIKTLLSLIGGIPDQLKKNIVLQQAASTFDIPANVLKNELSKLELASNHESIPEQALPESPLEGKNISILEKKSFYAILNYRNMLQSEDEEFLISMLPSILANLAIKVRTLHIQNSYSFNRFFDELSAEEKLLVTALDLEVAEYSSPDDVSKIIAQLYKKKWKIMLHEAKDILRTTSVETKNSMFLAIQELKQKLLQRGLL
jgi:DNA primase